MAEATREIAWPFRIGPTGGVDYVEDPYIAAVQHIQQLVLTQVGERLMRPGYGTPTQQYVFENNNDVVAAELAMRLQTAIAQWEPNIAVQRVVPRLDENEGLLEITVSFSVPPREMVHTTVVGVGGLMTGGIST